MSNTLEFTLGLDLAQASFDAAIARNGSKPSAWRQLPHAHFDLAPDSPQAVEALRDWMERTAPGGRCLRVIVESTGALSRRVAHALAPHGLAVAIINPRRSKAYGDSLGVRDKSDRIDCAILSLFGLVHEPAPTPLPEGANEQVRELSRLRQRMVEEITAWSNRRSQLTGMAGRAAITKTMKFLGRQVIELDRQVQELIDEDPVLSAQVRALMKIKGIKEVTARTLTAELGDLRQYSRAQLVALAGLFPKQFDSGSSVHRRPRLAKGGGGRLRRVLYMGATSLFRSKGVMRVWIEDHLRNGQEKMAVEVRVMRKLLLVARAVMVNGGHYDPSKIGCAEVFS